MIKTKETRPKKLTVGCFVNPPEGAEHGLKHIESKIGHHNYFKNFLKIATLMLDRKRFLSQN